MLDWQGSDCDGSLKLQLIWWLMFAGLARCIRLTGKHQDTVWETKATVMFHAMLYWATLGPAINEDVGTYHLPKHCYTQCLTLTLTHLWKIFFLIFWPEFLAYFSRIMCPAPMQKYFRNGLRSTTMGLRGWFGLQIPQISIQHPVPHWVRAVLAAKWGPIGYYTDRHLISVYYDLKAYNIVNKLQKKHKK